MRLAATPLVIAALATVAYGDGSARKRAMEEMRDKIEYFDKKCGGRLAVAIDFQSFAGHYQHQSDDEMNAGGYCNDVVDSMGWLCSDDEALKAPMRAIRHVRCGYDGSLGRELALELRGDTLNVRLDWDTDNVSDRLRKWAENLPAAEGDATAAEVTAGDGDAPPPPKQDGHGGHGGHLTVAQARNRAAAQPALDNLASGLRKACGVAIPVTLDWASFDGHLGGGQNESSAAGWCSQQVEQIGKMCKRNAEEKRTIAREITSVTCHWDDTAKEFKFTHANNALDVGYSWESGDSGNNLLRYLWNTLD